MAARQYLSVAEAAAELGVNEARVRALLKAGRLQGDKQAGRWLVDRRGVWRRQRAGGRRGRRLRPANAWGVLALASGHDAGWLAPAERYRMRQLLERDGVEGLRPSLEARARVHRFHAHPGVLRDLGEHPGLIRTGVSGSGDHRLGLVAGDEIDAYARPSVIDKLVRKYALERDGDDVNVVLRELPDEAPPLPDRVAPLAAVALDLAEDADARSARIGHRVLRDLGAAAAWRAKS